MSDDRVDSPGEIQGQSRGGGMPVFLGRLRMR